MLIVPEITQCLFPLARYYVVDLCRHCILLMYYTILYILGQVCSVITKMMIKVAPNFTATCHKNVCTTRRCINNTALCYYYMQVQRIV